MLRKFLYFYFKKNEHGQKTGCKYHTATMFNKYGPSQLNSYNGVLKF